MIDWHYELALQQELERAEEQMAAYLTARWDPFKESTPLKEGVEMSGLTPSQFSQLSTLARESEAVPVVINYLRYQIGRSDKGKAWRWNDVGMTLVSTLEREMRTLAQQTASRAAERIGAGRAEATPAQLQAAWIAVAQRFLALLARRFEQRYRDADV